MDGRGHYAGVKRISLLIIHRMKEYISGRTGYGTDKSVPRPG
jgi:hypothetical protein